MISQTDGRRESKSVNKEEERKSKRRLRNEIKRATDKQKRNIWRAFITIP
jgi:hypothetical protein